MVQEFEANKRLQELTQSSGVLAGSSGVQEFRSSGVGRSSGARVIQREPIPNCKRQRHCEPRMLKQPSTHYSRLAKAAPELLQLLNSFLLLFVCWGRASRQFATRHPLEDTKEQHHD